jgi:hypothetical protein
VPEAPAKLSRVHIAIRPFVLALTVHLVVLEHAKVLTAIIEHLTAVAMRFAELEFPVVIVAICFD